MQKPYDRLQSVALVTEIRWVLVAMSLNSLSMCSMDSFWWIWIGSLAIVNNALVMSTENTCWEILYRTSGGIFERIVWCSGWLGLDWLSLCRAHNFTDKKMGWMRYGFFFFFLLQFVRLSKGMALSISSQSTLSSIRISNTQQNRFRSGKRQLFLLAIHEI